MFIYIVIIITIMFLILGFLIVPYIQNKITFAPTKLANNYDHDLETHEKMMKALIHDKVTLTEHNIKSGKNTLNLLYLHNPESKNYVIYFHGNAGNNQTNINVLYDFSICNVILFDYSGYGKSTGRPTISVVCKDAYNVWLFVTQKLGIKPENIILYGCSLGGAIASHLIYKLYKKNRGLAKAIILQSSFASSLHLFKDMAPKIIYYLAHLFVNNTFNSIKYLKALNNKVKIMITHSKKDDIISFKHSELFAQKINCDHIIIKGTHNKYEFTEEFWEFFNTCL